uniref:Uncharacterized protein n=1 Tax=Cannabis sativa TaxID=3483 RepID=A0A803QS06_CANSA
GLLLPLAHPIPKGIKYLSALFVLYASKKWGIPSPQEVAWFFDLKSSPARRVGYFYFSKSASWLDGNDKAIAKIGHFVDKYFM